MKKPIYYPTSTWSRVPASHWKFFAAMCFLGPFIHLPMVGALQWLVLCFLCIDRAQDAP